MPTGCHATARKTGRTQVSVLEEALTKFLADLTTDEDHAAAVARRMAASEKVVQAARALLTDADRAEVELRSSWTPTLDSLRTLTPHLAAWQELLGQIAGEPDLPPGVAALPLGRRA